MNRELADLTQQAAKANSNVAVRSHGEYEVWLADRELSYVVTIRPFL